MLHFGNPETGEKRNPWATEKKMRCKVWIFTLFGGKLQYKKRYRKRHNCIIYGICYGVGDGIRTHEYRNHNPVP